MHWWNIHLESMLNLKNQKQWNIAELMQCRSTGKAICIKIGITLLTIPRPSSIFSGPKRSDVAWPGSVQTDNATPIVPITSDACWASAATSARDRPAAAAAPATYVENISYNLNPLKFFVQQVTTEIFYEFPVNFIESVDLHKKGRKLSYKVSTAYKKAKAWRKIAVTLKKIFDLLMFNLLYSAKCNQEKRGINREFSFTLD